MNYYERHLGDYAKDTAHLSMVEHGAYTLLLDRYYSTEAGIPADQVYRVARARSPEERQAVDVVLAEFFKLTDGVWVKERCEEEIAKAQARIERAKLNGKRGGRPKNPEETQKEPSGFPVGSVLKTQTKALHSPLSTLHTPHEEKDSAACARARVLPEGEMAIALRDLGVAVRSTDPVLHDWLRDGFTVQQAVDAVGIARIRKPHPEVIPANYLDPILRQPLRPPAVKNRPKGAFERLMEANADD